MSCILSHAKEKGERDAQLLLNQRDYRNIREKHIEKQTGGQQSQN